MAKPCAVVGCRRAATRYSPHCEHHRTHARRHGHAEQLPLRAHEIEEHRAAVRAFMARHPKEEGWAIIGRRWKAVLAEAQGEIDARESGHATARHHYESAKALQRLAGRVEYETLLETALALLLHLEANPGRYRSDDAFRFQFARIMRRLAPITATGTAWDEARGRVRKTYRDWSPRLIRSFANRLLDAFGAAGIGLARRLKAAEARRQEEARRLADSLDRMVSA
jgi:hypothetical protein